MPQPISIRRQEAHRARNQSPARADCHAYPEDRTQGCYCSLMLDHNGAHACACGSRWIGEH